MAPTLPPIVNKEIANPQQKKLGAKNKHSLKRRLATIVMGGIATGNLIMLFQGNPEARSTYDPEKAPVRAVVTDADDTLSVAVKDAKHFGKSALYTAESYAPVATEIGVKTIQTGSAISAIVATGALANFRVNRKRKKSPAKTVSP